MPNANPTPGKPSNPTNVREPSNTRPPSNPTPDKSPRPQEVGKGVEPENEPTDPVDAETEGE